MHATLCWFLDIGTNPKPLKRKGRPLRSAPKTVVLEEGSDTTNERDSDYYPVSSSGGDTLSDEDIDNGDKIKFTEMMWVKNCNLSVSFINL